MWKELSLISHSSAVQEGCKYLSWCCRDYLSWRSMVYQTVKCLWEGLATGGHDVLDGAWGTTSQSYQYLHNCVSHKHFKKCWKVMVLCELWCLQMSYDLIYANVSIVCFRTLWLWNFMPSRYKHTYNNIPAPIHTYVYKQSSHWCHHCHLHSSHQN